MFAELIEKVNEIYENLNLDAGSDREKSDIISWIWHLFNQTRTSIQTKLELTI